MESLAQFFQAPATRIDCVRVSTHAVPEFMALEEWSQCRVKRARKIPSAIDTAITTYLQFLQGDP